MYTSQKNDCVREDINKHSQVINATRYSKKNKVETLMKYYGGLRTEQDKEAFVSALIFEYAVIVTKS